MHRSALFIIPLALLILGGLWFFTMRGSLSGGPQSEMASTTPAYAYPGAADPAQAAPQAGASSSTQITNGQTNHAHIMQATLHTNQGDITFQFDRELSPTAVDNFITLAQKGFYDGTKFHRVIKGFMIQGGDPLSKDDGVAARWGTGGPGYKFDDEITPDSKNVIGAVAMANSGPDTNGSQFYINTANNSFLDGKYTVFAHVVSGMDVVTKIENTATDPSNDRPLSPMVVTSVSVQ